MFFSQKYLLWDFNGIFPYRSSSYGPMETSSSPFSGPGIDAAVGRFHLLLEGLSDTRDDQPFGPLERRDTTQKSGLFMDITGY